MAHGDGFVGRCDVVEPRRGNRHWPAAVKASGGEPSAWSSGC